MLGFGDNQRQLVYRLKQLKGSRQLSALNFGYGRFAGYGACFVSLRPQLIDIL